MPAPRASALLLALAAACGSTGSSAGETASETADAGVPAAPQHPVFGPATLHRVEIELTPADLAHLDVASDTRVPCTFRFDGVALERVGIRKRGGLSSRRPAGDKTGWSVKFDELVPGQELHGLDKLLLNAEVADPSFLNEHLAYEIARRAGVPAKRTSFALVRVNGEDRGVFVVTEAVDRKFLARAFGDGNQDGNLYEIPCCGDFVGAPGFPELKDEAEEGRSRADLIALSDAIETAPDADFADRVARLMDLDRFVTTYAIDALVYHWDGYTFNGNNTYIYHDPDDDRLVFLPHGMDRLFWRDPDHDALAYPVGPDTRTGRLSERVRDTLDGAYRARIAEVLAGAWDLDVLAARVDEVAAALASGAADAGGRTRVDLAGFATWQGRTREVLAARKCRFGVRQGGAACGDGSIDTCESCDDGNTTSGDGCSATCALEHCGDGVRDAGEACDGPDCALDCQGPRCETFTVAAGTFAFCRRPATWFDAAADCGARGGTLAAPRSSAEQSLLVATALGYPAADWWIGVREEDGGFVAVDGAGLYPAWAPGKPDAPDDQHCVLLDFAQAGAWNDMSCYDAQPYVCRL